MPNFPSNCRNLPNFLPSKNDQKILSKNATKDTNRKIRKTEFIYNTSVVIPKMIPAAAQ